MNCINVKKILNRYQDNELGDIEREKLSNHLEICTECSKELTEMNNIISDLLKLESVPAPLNFEHKIMSQIYKKEDKRVSFFPVRYISIVYTLIFIIFFSFGLFLIDIENPQKNIIISNADINISALLASEQELGLLDIQGRIINLVEIEIKNEN